MTESMIQPKAGRPEQRTARTAPESTTAPEPHPADGHEATTLLERTKAAVDPVLRTALGSLPAPMRRVALYHFGWQNADGTPADGGAGKAIRPALVLAAASALGGPAARTAALRAAAAVELVHNFTLVHDDVMDRDTTRRHRPTVWTVFGDADAILVGTPSRRSPCGCSPRTPIRRPRPRRPGSPSAWSNCARDSTWTRPWSGVPPTRSPSPRRSPWPRRRPGPSSAAPAPSARCTRTRGDAEVAAMDAFGREAGLAFQLIDDVIGIWGDPRRTGKPAGADLAARKKSLPVVAALTSGTPEAAELATAYAAPHREEDVEHLTRLVESAGGRDWAQTQAADRMARAMQEVARAVPDPEAAGGLLALAEFVTRRST